MAKKNEIAKAEAVSILPVEQIEGLILTIRGKQVILDRDLAGLYGVDTKVLNQAVKRNVERFPEHFRYQLTENETNELVTNCDRLQNLKHSNFLPYVFTEQGVAMLSTVLRSETAVNVSIRIMDAFVAMRHFIGSHAQVFQRIEILERTQLSLVAFKEETNRNFAEVFKRLDDGEAKPEHGIFFDGQIFDSYTFITDRIREAKKRIILIDNYIDDSVLKMLDKREKGVTVKLYTNLSFGSLKMDLKKHNAQYAPIDAEQFNRSHDRFLCIDDTVYLVGASLKDLGKKWFGFSKMGLTTDELLSKM